MWLVAYLFVGSADRARGSLLISDSGVKEVSVGVEVEVCGRVCASAQLMTHMSTAELS